MLRFHRAALPVREQAPNKQCLLTQTSVSPHQLAHLHCLCHTCRQTLHMFQSQYCDFFDESIPCTDRGWREFPSMLKLHQLNQWRGSVYTAQEKSIIIQHTRCHACCMQAMIIIILSLYNFFNIQWVHDLVINLLVQAYNRISC